MTGVGAGEAGGGGREGREMRLNLREGLQPVMVDDSSSVMFRDCHQRFMGLESIIK
jgi:phage-related minor tail protein